MQHVYFGIENLGLNATQRQTLIDALKALGPSSDPSPARLNHWRTRLDGEAAIFEALFNTDNISVQAFKNRLAAIFGVDPATISHSVVQVVFDVLSSAVTVFSRNSTNYLRLVIFGYDGVDWPTWMQSGDECRAYLALYRDAWEVDNE